MHYHRSNNLVSTTNSQNVVLACSSTESVKLSFPFIKEQTFTSEYNCHLRVKCIDPCHKHLPRITLKRFPNTQRDLQKASIKIVIKPVNKNIYYQTRGFICKTDCIRSKERLKRGSDTNVSSYGSETFSDQH